MCLPTTCGHWNHPGSLPLARILGRTTAEVGPIGTWRNSTIYLIDQCSGLWCSSSERILQSPTPHWQIIRDNFIESCGSFISSPSHFFHSGIVGKFIPASASWKLLIWCGPLLTPCWNLFNRCHPQIFFYIIITNHVKFHTLIVKKPRQKRILVIWWV